MGLPWARTDTNLPTHDKILDLIGMGPKGKGAAFVYVSSYLYAADNGTDGLIKKAVLPFIHCNQAEAKLLVAVGLWEAEPPSNYRIKNYGTKQAVGFAQQALHEARSAAGKKGADSRWGE
ncbi:hypothetical protein FND50_25170 [Rhodococcus sp. WB9]|uniref:hypothetical protein n=1 Tax=Rhodococcus sp. WB9 TaxID=2594007 RepID=UPI001186B4E2|nr:hypothetical protein [Rhodococcus sp. WB9]QDQ93723.1 hypothetical protein FND50_25170 [Rhodococcus sp. WB9]